MDHKVVIGIAVSSLLAGMLCGALPAWRSSHAPAVEALKAESASISGGSRNRKLLSGLVVAQIALSLPLLLCSGLFLRTLRNLAGANPGFEQDHILTASVGLNIAGYSNDEEQVIRHKILDRVSALAWREGCVSYGLDSDEPEPQEGGCVSGRVCAAPP